MYAHRSKGGRGLTSIEDLYEIRMVGLMEHLEQVAEEHSLLKLVEEHERETIRRLGRKGEKHTRKAVMSKKEPEKSGKKNGKEKSRMDTCRRHCQRMKPST